ncbi:MAG: prephenate dehydrogenase/arogenate dehydrogenase family protein [Desulforhopalus sp.]
MRKKVVSVYGYGRFGKLWADILSGNFQVKVYSRRGLNREDVSPGLEIADDRTIFECDALFFCVAISAFEELLQKCAAHCRKETVFFDTCSVKVLPARWMQTYLPSGSRIIATHPMFGPDSYQKTDRELPMVMCNISADQDIFDFWVDYFSTRSMRVEPMSVDKHDELTAYSQGITHYVGRLFADLHLQPTRIDTLGYQMLLDVMGQTCNDSWQLFLDLQSYNPYAKKMRTSLQESIEKINEALACNGKSEK